VRISGIRLQGAEMGIAGEDTEMSDGITVYSSVNVAIDHNELSGWRGAAVEVRDGRLVAYLVADTDAAWRDWLLRAAAGSPSELQIMYGLSGERRLREWDVPWLPGYEKSQPVRIGNAAHEQFQLDVYGEVMDALHQARIDGLPADDHAWSLQRFSCSFPGQSRALGPWRPHTG
jgi:hypothetical protein